MLKLHVSALVLLLSASFALAGQMKHPSGFTFWTPDGWKSATEGASMEVHDPAGEVTVVLFTPTDVKEMDAALKGLDQEIAKWVTDLKVGEPEKGTEEGVNYVMVEGTAKMKGKGVDLGVGIFESEGDLLVVFAAVDASVADKHEATVEKILDSIDAE